MKPGWVKKSAREMIDKLLCLAESNPKKAKRYAELAKKKSRKYKAPLPPRSKRGICKKCGAFLVPGKNLRVRKEKQVLVYTCLECGKKARYGAEKLKKQESP